MPMEAMEEEGRCCCLAIHLCISIYLCFCISIHLCISIYLLSIYPSMCLHLSMLLSIFPSIHLCFINYYCMIYSAYGGGNRYPNNIPSGYGGATAYNRPGYTNPVPNAGYGGYPKCVIIMLYCDSHLFSHSNSHSKCLQCDNARRQIISNMRITLL